jgi:NTP pyrophosphatase (non-canonical NTP hydrolase)
MVKTQGSDAQPVADSQVNVVTRHQLPSPPPALEVFRHYYRQTAAQRGYERQLEGCLLLMVEEIVELARAVKERQCMVLDKANVTDSEMQELADVCVYVIHMANILQRDLGEVLKDRERLNLKKIANTK